MNHNINKVKSRSLPTILTDFNSPVVIIMHWFVSNVTFVYMHILLGVCATGRQWTRCISCEDWV